MSTEAFNYYRTLFDETNPPKSDDVTIITTNVVPKITIEDKQALNKWNYVPPSIMNEKVWLLGCEVDNPYEPGKRPHYLSSSGNPVPASIDVNSHYMSYDEAVSYADANGVNLGFVHTTDLGVCTIDIDIKDTTTESVRQACLQLLLELDSYVEYSNSGKGFHCLLRTEELISLHPVYPSQSPIPIEIYSFKRFMLTTGREVRLVKHVNEETNESSIEVIELQDHAYDDIYRKQPSYRNEQLTALITQLGGNERQFDELVEYSSIVPDEDVLQLVAEDHHATKFFELCDLSPTFDFTKVGFPSCSEVDLFLIGKLASYTVSNEQVRRIFRGFAIAKRDKHTKRDYHLDKALIKIRTDIANKIAEAAETEKAMSSFLNNINERIAYEKEELRKQGDVPADKLELEQYNPTNEFEHQIPFPHGMAGIMCNYLMDIAPHKLPEAALVGTLATLSAICGRQFQHNGAGLNNYYVVVAPSATGKETARRGVGRFAAATAVVGGDKFFNFDTMASKQAYLAQFAASETLSTLVFVPEFSKYVACMTQKQNNTMQQIYSFWLEIFPRSAKGDINGGNRRANAEESTQQSESPALTLMCDTTGDDYYEQITEQMQRDGFMSRFVNVECYNPMKKLSDTECHKVIMPVQLASDLRDLTAYVLKLKKDGNFIDVHIEPTIRQHIRAFERYTLSMVNKTRDERYRQPYNRCFLKIMTIASLLAVTRNKFDPIISMEDFEWSKSLIMRDVYNITRKLDNGTFGTSDDNNEKIVKHEIRRILHKKSRTEGENKKYGELLNKGIIPRSAITAKVTQYSNFGRQNMTASDTLDRIMFNFEKNGWIRCIDKSNRHAEFTAMGFITVPFFGNCFVLQNGDVFITRKPDDVIPMKPEIEGVPNLSDGIVPITDPEFYSMELPTVPEPIRKKPGRRPKVKDTEDSE